MTNLTNSSGLPFIVSMACLTGYFQDPSSVSFASAAMTAPNGAVAVWASSGLPGLPGEVQVDQALLSVLLNGSRPALGDAVAQAKAATTDGDVRRTWIFFGDPTMKLAQ
jgi:hypothetical protein